MSLIGILNLAGEVWDSIWLVSMIGCWSAVFGVNVSKSLLDGILRDMEIP